MDSTTREPSASPDQGLPSQHRPVPDRVPPAAFWLVRWGLVIHIGLWVLVTLAQAVGLAADTAAPTAGSWLRLVLALATAAAFGVTAQRIGPGRPGTWTAALALQLLAVVGYALFTWSLVTGSEQALAPVPFTLLVGVPVVAASLAGIVLTLGAGVRRHCLSTTP